ncbi:Citrate lyase beta subunit [Blautia hydrogenotrophica]|uniref:cysteine protease StiP family protein n=1 Tax=Blautia hydrogenotrophica TaxID=53443 RepID=UPI0006C0F2E1|nr:cysteine protease StiP family protein [Blautia hydrogenotrophica]CUM98060.1 Citrate lyase beta subunit [Blautia hydrogenotrophica]SCH88816.1 Citrate lyase beta subunit [uncultured Blautia sp.]
MRTTYKKEDVELLLKDITGLVKPQSTQEREQLIQQGWHYCEMLPIEYSPSEAYMEAYETALKVFADSTSEAVGVLADKIMEEKGRSVVLVSLARAGTPVGILLKRYLRWKYGITVPHYSISIIRGRGIDQNAMRYLLCRYRPEDMLFVDGWIGKGAILSELRKAVADFPGVSPELAVLADPANVTKLCGTHEDILIPSSCLNCTVSGLVSRTFLRDDIIGETDFHGAVYYGELEAQDLSYAFISEIQSRFQKEYSQKDTGDSGQGLDEVLRIGREFKIEDVNLIKPGIGETTRVLLRRVPWKVLVHEKYMGDKALEHILRLAKEKNVPVQTYPLKNYKACGIIKKLADA